MLDHNNINSGAFIQSAVVYDANVGQIIGSITADKVSPETHSPDKYHFYCADCLNQEQPHAMRMKRVPADISGVQITPPRFVHYKHEDATHVCDHVVRYKKLDDLALRYNAESLGDHAYIFDLDLRYEREQNLRVVDRASRMVKLTEALLYDVDLRAKQKIRFGGEVRSFEEGLYRSSPDEKMRLFQESLDAVNLEKIFQATQIFRPIGNRALWKAYESKNCIPGMAGGDVDYSGIKMRPSALLWCDTKTIYEEVRAIANRNSVLESSALMVFGDAQFSLKRAQERVAIISSGKKVMHALHTVFKIKNINQVEPWDYTLTFAEVAKHQDNVQVQTPRAVFAPQMALDL